MSATDDTIADLEVIVRRIPMSAPWFEPPDRITSANFKLRPNEIGLSVYRLSLVSANDVLTRPEATPGSFLVFAAVADIRALASGNGQQFELDVIADDPDGLNPGHALICSPSGRFSGSMSKALRDVFTTDKLQD